MLADAVVAIVLVVLVCYFACGAWRVWAGWYAGRVAERVCEGTARQRQAVAAAWEYAYVRMRVRASDAERFASWYGEVMAVSSLREAGAEWRVAAGFAVWARNQGFRS